MTRLLLISLLVCASRRLLALCARKLVSALTLSPASLLSFPSKTIGQKRSYTSPSSRDRTGVDVDIDKNSTIFELKKFVAQRTKYDPSKMICAESYKNKFYKIFDNTENITETNIITVFFACTNFQSSPRITIQTKRRNFPTSHIPAEMPI